MKLFTLFFMMSFLILWTNCEDDTTAPGTTMTPEATETTGSGNYGTVAADNTTETETTATITTTAAPSTPATCKPGQISSGCKCDDATTPYGGFCAAPCDPEYVWCPVGQTCDRTSESNFTCQCAIGFYADPENGFCTQGKFFGGKMVFNDTFQNNETWKDEKKKDIEQVLIEIFNSSGKLINATVLKLEKGSIIESHRLIFRQDVTEKDVQNSFNESCVNVTVADENAELKLDCEASAETVIDDTVLCNSEDYQDYCDSDSSECQNTNGGFWCSCKVDYARIDSNPKACSKITCTINSQCNDPFGECKTFDSEAENYCECMWGFSGNLCKESWEFVFTIVTAVLGIILIIVIIVLICKSRKMKSHKNKPMTEDLNLKNPFVDFQPGVVRAKLPSTMHHAYDSLDLRDGSNGNAKRNSYSNGAYSAEDPYQKKPSTFQNDYQSVNLNAAGKQDTDYF